MSTFMCIGGQEKFETLNLVEQESWRETKSIYIFTTLKKKKSGIHFRDEKVFNFGWLINQDSDCHKHSSRLKNILVVS